MKNICILLCRMPGAGDIEMTPSMHLSVTFLFCTVTRRCISVSVPSTPVSRQPMSDFFKLWIIPWVNISRRFFVPKNLFLKFLQFF